MSLNYDSYEREMKSLVAVMEDDLETVLRELWDTAYEQGKKDNYNEAYDEGYEDGFDKGQEDKE
jgi:flagellar biosynthesis/type III secretory pathway protein FliH